jgi:hypothetical protein
VVIVRFLQHAGSYNPGDVAGFEPYRARELVAAGVAEVVAQPTPAPEPVPDDTHHRAVLSPGAPSREPHVRRPANRAQR